jgi:hypothetical protein
MNLQISSKKRFTLTVLAAGLLGVGNSVAAEQQSAIESSAAKHLHCSNETLTGRFALLSALNFVPGGPPPTPLVPGANMGIMTLDASGHLSFEVTISKNGQISRQTQLGTYTVKADCTGQMTVQPTDLPFPLDFDIVVANLKDQTGKEFYAIGATPGGVLTFTAKRIQ